MLRNHACFVDAHVTRIPHTCSKIRNKQALKWKELGSDSILETPEEEVYGSNNSFIIEIAYCCRWYLKTKLSIEFEKNPCLSLSRRYLDADQAPDVERWRRLRWHLQWQLARGYWRDGRAAEAEGEIVKSLLARPVLLEIGYRFASQQHQDGWMRIVISQILKSAQNVECCRLNMNGFDWEILKIQREFAASFRSSWFV